MAVLKFDKDALANLEYSLGKEFISSNRAGGYMSTTIIGCNTRKYHGLMVCPIENYDTQNFVLLSSMDETIIQRGKSFNLAIHAFPETFEPKGHKYIRSFDYTPTPTITYSVGGVVMKKELLWLHNKQQLLIKYTLVEATSPTTLRLRPFLAFRQAHALSKMNMDADTKSYPVENGVKNCLYQDFPYLYLQFSCQNEFYPAPDWYCNFEYAEDKKRGYEYTEDLLTTGVFEIDFTKKKTVILSCSLSEVNPKLLKSQFDKEIAKRSSKTEFLPCLKHSARQFVVKQSNEIKVIAGYPWFERRGRDTLMSTPWITLTQDNSKDFVEILKTMVSNMRNGVFRCFIGQYESADTSLWFFNSLQQLTKSIGEKSVWKEFGSVMTALIENYATGLSHMGITMHDNGLIWASKHGRALTWMDMHVDGKPVTQRSGYAVEINAMWYNAICFTLEMAKKHKETKFVEKWESYPAKIKESFNELFWIKDKKYYADHINENGVNKQIRPNQIIACALPYKIAEEENIKGVLDTVDRYLLTTHGIRTLAPDDAEYVGEYYGDENERALAQHQGSTRAWLLPYYFAANFAIYGDGFIYKAEEMIANFEECILSYGIGTLPELFNGNPPHTPGGAISQAISVGALLKCVDMLEKRKENK